jgi:hypothetical protein
MRLIRLAIGVSLVAVSVLGSARAQSPTALSQVSGQEALGNRFESPVSETDRLSDRQQLIPGPCIGDSWAIPQSPRV